MKKRTITALTSTACKISSDVGALRSFFLISQVFDLLSSKAIRRPRVGPMIQLFTPPTQPMVSIIAIMGSIQSRWKASKNCVNVSMMPEGLLDNLSKNEVVDLIGYLQTDR